ncbi:MAG: DUF1761 domain-containing protein [Phenylobacterium sp.]
MGSVNWLAVLLAANFAAALRIVWYSALFGQATFFRPEHERTRPPSGRLAVRWGGLILLLAIPAAMFGHMFARLTPGKPWLYFMMSGGVALTFVLPALSLALGRQGLQARAVVVEAGYWLAAFLAIGATFWALR